MKKQIFALYPDIDVADEVINQLHNEAKIPTEEISYVYRDQNGERIAHSGEDVASKTPAEGAQTGATTGGIIGAVLGIVAVAGLAGPLGPIFAAGPIATALGLTGALGTTAAGAIGGAAVGGLVGALTNMGLGEPRARDFEERLKAGDVLVIVHADNDEEVIAILKENNADVIELVEAKV